MASSYCSWFYNAWLISLAYFTLTCTSTPLSLPFFSSLSSTTKPIANGTPLRILPLGDSITYGQGSTDGTGYRLPLFTLLNPTNPLEYIGRERHGNMPNGNNHHEGHKGFPIGPIGNTAKPNFDQHPNIVLLMAGTNDIVFQINLADAPNVLGRVIDEIVAGCADAVVLVATLTPLLDEKREGRRRVFNQALEGVVGARREKKVLLVDMGRVDTVGGINGTDGIHPTDLGYRLMAEAWFEGIVRAGEMGWIGKPVGRLGNGDDGVSGVVMGPGRNVSWSSGSMLGIGVGVFIIGFAVHRIYRMGYAGRWTRRYGW
ncbi:hypothetical protein AJ79_08146 [Helicocarpus griseus UAMH5409]|uniref:SGNH hydrolase-type esterase domain-containing protein n=1 Tax=Helicocarpus griseus UAMH5409 TaxID=1447875 RepID=A0A2B7WVM2_9EURO|nr:hypothetical protein AJ79_08146 [Helicocarpus griseus UAMH5409]